MSLRASLRVWDSDNLKPIEKLTLLAIADYARDDGSGAYPSVSKLTRKVGLATTRYMQRVIRSLQLRGMLRVSVGAGPGGVNVYDLTLPDPPDREMEPESDPVIADPAKPKKQAQTSFILADHPWPTGHPPPGPPATPPLVHRPPPPWSTDRPIQSLNRHENGHENGGGAAAPAPAAQEPGKIVVSDAPTTDGADAMEREHGAAPRDELIRRDRAATVLLYEWLWATGRDPESLTHTDREIARYLAALGQTDDVVGYIRWRAEMGKSPDLRFIARDYTPNWRRQAGRQGRDAGETAAAPAAPDQYEYRGYRLNTFQDETYAAVMEAVASCTVPANYNRWLAGTQGRLDLAARRLVITVPNTLGQAQIERRFARNILLALAEIAGDGWSIAYDVAAGEETG